MAEYLRLHSSTGAVPHTTAGRHCEVCDGALPQRIALQDGDGKLQPIKWRRHCRPMFYATLFQVDIMVNTTGRDLQLSNGAVSKLILSAAGPEIQAECQKLAPNGTAFGAVIETAGYALPCRRVYHGACQNWDGGAGPCEQVS